MLVAELLHKRYGWASENSRKFLHVSGGLCCLTLPSVFRSHWPILLMTSVAFLLLLITFLRKLLPSVHQTKRYSVGSLLFPIPVYLCFLVADIEKDFLLYYLPISLLTISDTLAEICGNRWGYHTLQFFRRQKSLAGSLAFLFSSFIISLLWLGLFSNEFEMNSIAIAAIIAVGSALAELVTLHGWDNLTIPAITTILLILLP